MIEFDGKSEAIPDPGLPGFYPRTDYIPPYRHMRDCFSLPETGVDLGGFFLEQRALQPGRFPPAAEQFLTVLIEGRDDCPASNQKEKRSN